MNSQGQLCFSRLEKHFNTRHVLSIGRLVLAPGRVVHLTGRNGAGKTTLLKILAGLEPPDRCDVLLNSCNRPWHAVRQRLRHDVVYLHQQPCMFDGTVADNLGYGMRVTGVPRVRRRQAVAGMLERLGLEHAAPRNARTLSGGEQQRLALGRAWLLQPRVLLLDEPTANMDREFRRQTWSLLQEVLSDEIAIMVSSHELTESECPNCLNLHLQDCRLNAGPPSLHLVGQVYSRSQEVHGVKP
jgi:ABC-type multidrug transport system ATPase subunit